MSSQIANPYPGLRPFHDDEEHLFFGRERQVDAMVDKLRATGFLAVLGASGSGKSSLVNCGLRPALYRGLMDTAGSAWRTAQFRPGNRVMRALATALCAKGALFERLHSEDFSAEALVESTLRSSRLGLIDAYSEAHLPPGTQLLLVVDQFEELFRYRSLAATGASAAKVQEHGLGADAVAFVNLLLAVREQPGCPIHVVITMRSDFLGDCAQFHGLPEALNVGQYLVPRLTRAERRMAITGPAGVEGASISPVLLTRLVNDVGDNPDQLSILQHALNQTWAKWDAEGRPGGELQLSHYEAIGTMSAALDNHARRVFNTLDATQKTLAQRLFKVLTDSGTDARGIRRPTTFATLCEITQARPEAMLAVMAVFREPSCSFLMPALAETVDANTVIDISHESLMRVWKQLQDWGVEEAQAAQMLRRLADSAKAYPEGKESLWQDPKLQLALNWERQQQPNAAWARLYGVELAPAVKFLRESEAARAEVAAAAKARADASAQRARRRRMAWAVSVFGAMLATMLWLWSNSRAESAKVLALQEQARREAERNEERLVASELFKLLQTGRDRDLGTEASAEVPELRGLNKAEALQRLQALQLGTDGVSEVIHHMPAGTVLDQFPRPPSRLPLAEPVYLVVATTEAEAKRKEQQAEKAAAEAAQAAATAKTAPAAAASATPPAPPPAVEAPVAVAPAPPPEPVPVAEAEAKPTPVGAAEASSCSAGPWGEWLDNAQFQAVAARQKADGKYPASIQGKLDGRDLKFRAVFAPRPPGGSFNWDIYRSSADRRTLENVRGKLGFTISCAQSFADAKGEPRWQITWLTH
jgi:energy-coupling factor transporter ATP-binding protein EcfA2